VPNSPRSIAVRAPAKINLLLRVGPPRPDGYHDLRTVFHAIDLCDVVTAGPSDSLSLSVAGAEGSGLPADERNLAWRAAAELAEHAGVEARARLAITKSIPVAAGLAGGSADAAATLIACDRLWDLDSTGAELDAIAARLGSDVTFALHGRSALGVGRGERLDPITADGRLHWAVAAADAGLATPAVYRELDRLRAEGAVPAPDLDAAVAESDAVCRALAAGRPAALAALLANDLQPAALSLAPQLGATLAAGDRLGALAGIVSGSGPTCVFLAADRQDAERLAAELAASGTCRFARPVVGGVAGAAAQASARAAVS